MKTISFDTYSELVSKQKGDVIFMLPSQEIFPAIFSNETVDLSGSNSVLKNIMQNINCEGQNAGSNENTARNITVKK